MGRGRAGSEEMAAVWVGKSKLSHPHGSLSGIIAVFPNPLRFGKDWRKVRETLCGIEMHYDALGSHEKENKTPASQQ